MLRGIFSRAVVAIFLMAALLAPLSTCLPHAHMAGHSCCSRASGSAAVKGNCCIVRPQLPAMPQPSSLAAAAPMAALHTDLSVLPATRPARSWARSLVPPHSPPGGLFILRI